MSKLQQFKLKTTNNRVYLEALNKLTAIMKGQPHLTGKLAVVKLIILYPGYSNMKKSLISFSKSLNSN